MIAVHTHILENGLRVVICPNHKAPVLNVTVAYKVGSKDESPTHTGLAHLFEHLMFDNIRSDDGTKFDMYVTQSGGESNAYTNYDYTLYHVSLPSNQAAIGMWLESQRMRSFVIPQSALDTQINVVSEEILQVVKNQPYGNWRELQAHAGFDEDCMYHWEVIGSHEHVRKTSYADASAWYERFYRPQNAVLVLSGDITVESAKTLAEEYFADIPGGSHAAHRNAFKTSQRRRAHVSDTQDVPFDALFLSYHFDGFLDDRTLAADMLSSILSHGQSSRLYRAMIHDKQIASDVGCFADKREYSSLLTLYAFAGSEEFTTEIMREEFLKQIDSICRDGVQSEELTKARNKLQTGLAYELQSSGGVADVVAQQLLFWNDAERINTLMQRYNTITTDDVVECARSIFRAQNLVQVDIKSARDVAAA